MLKIGNIKVPSRLILAPMAGISDLPYRLLNRDFGAELAFVEMINVRSLSHRSVKTKQMMSTNPGDTPLGVQILGSEPKYILKGLEVLRSYRYDILDFNAACPVKKVVRRGEGSALLKDIQKLKALLKIVVKESTVPVTVKIRSGWDKNSLNAVEAAKVASDVGVCAVFIHGRTKAQGYSGTVDYKVIRDVKKAVFVPVIASGDIFSGVLAKKMFDETGCDGIAVARGALGNPWIFKEIKAYLKNNDSKAKPLVKEVVSTMLLHLDMCVDFYGEKNGLVIFRKFFSWYTRGMRKVRVLREKSQRIRTRSDLVEIIDKIVL